MKLGVLAYSPSFHRHQGVDWFVVCGENIPFSKPILASVAKETLPCQGHLPLEGSENQCQASKHTPPELQPGRVPEGIS